VSAVDDGRVLIVGAGPTGLVLALRLARHGVPVRVVDRADGPGETSRAMAVHARTLELYDQLGVADEVVRRGIKTEALVMRRGGRRIASARFGDIGAGLSPFPYVLVFPQDDHERLLMDLLADAGVQVERRTELVDLADHGDRVTAVLRRDGGTETFDAPYVCGCDGAHSAVRRLVRLDFPGGTYQQVFFVADVQASGEAADRSVGLCLTGDGFCLVMPVRRTGAHRLIGIVPRAAQGRPEVTFEDVADDVRRFTGLSIEQVNWFSTYHVHHRVAPRFRRGRAFLLGDAGHIHSPAGGQGMNTGIGDAANLAWKLADVLRGRADDRLLDTYHDERIGFARTLVASTDRLFQLAASRGWVVRLLRERVVPHVFALAVTLRPVRRELFRRVSQTAIHYQDSSISDGQAGRVHGGDRLPWVPYGDADNFRALRSLRWQMHVYGSAAASLRAAAETHGIPLHELGWTGDAEKAGVEKDALYLVRPDGHVAFAQPEQDWRRVEDYLSRRGLRIGENATSVEAG
jgi:2-polyprenyl-6-methoxyphenol hydroxylase-like FAD-dependent oxidoreductase